MIRSDRFQQLSILGRGVSSTVYRAFDRQTQSWVALKHIDPLLTSDPTSLERFKRELQITRQINHPQVIQIFDLCEENGDVFLVMELLTGNDLTHAVKSQGPRPVPEVENILRQILEVLRACHEAYVIHRDIKPQNIFVLENQKIKILDFGIAKLNTLSDLTKSGAPVGTPRYMAPEIFSGTAADSRSDLYAVGVVAYELLTGKVPYDGDSVPQLLKQFETKAPPPLSRERADVPPWMSKLIGRLLSQNPAHRYQTAHEALWDLDRRQVASEIVPQTRKRPCLACEVPTLSDIPVCLHCGFDPDAAKSGQKYNLWVAANYSDAKLKEFLKSGLSHHERVNLSSGKRFLLLNNIERPIAELVQKSAQRYGLIVEISNQNFDGNKLRKFVLPIFILVATFLVVALEGLRNIGPLISHHRSRFHYPPSTGETLHMLLTQALGPATWAKIVGVIALAVFLSRRNKTKPLIENFGNVEMRITTMAWYSTLKQYLKIRPPRTISDINENIMNCFLIAVRSPRVSPILQSKLVEVLKATFRASAMLTDAHNRLAKLREADAITIEMSEQEEVYSRLNSKLVFLSSQFNSFVAKILLDQSAEIEREAEDLAGSVGELTKMAIAANFPEKRKRVSA